MNNNDKFLYIKYLIIEEILITISFIISFCIKYKNLQYLIYSSEYRILFMVLVFINAISIYIFGVYKFRTNNIVKYIFSSILLSITNFLILTLFLVMTKTSTNYSRIMIVGVFAVYVVLSIIFKFIYCVYKNNIKNQLNENGKIKILIITDNKNVKELSCIETDNVYEIIGLCVIDKNLKGSTLEKYSVVANKNDVLSYVCRNWVDEVCIFAKYSSIPKEIFEGLATAGIKTNLLVNKLDEFKGQEQVVRYMMGYPVLTSSIKERSNIDVVLKRLMDIVGGIIGSVITIVLSIVIGPIIYIKSPGPIFFKQERIGENGRRFYMYKFRSMIKNADELKNTLKNKNIVKDGMMFKIENDPRIIPGIGTFIRQTSLDEFPQFFNVLKGDMSLVGTRPPTVDEWIKYELEHRIKRSIKPGITRLWQTNGRSKITDFNKVVKYDTEYINNWSLFLDIEIIFKTIKVLIFDKREHEAL